MLRVLVVALALTVLLPGVAAAKEPAAVWATVNVCDTAKQPDAIGLRASMPGTPRGARLSMRFQVEYRATSKTAVPRTATLTAQSAHWRRRRREVASRPQHVTSCHVLAASQAGSAGAI